MKTVNCLICGMPYHYRLITGGVCDSCRSSEWEWLRDRRKQEGKNG